jgi:hypothetical protein
MNSTKRAPFLQAIDEVLLPLGFSRRKKDLEWRRITDGGDVEWVHCNFGLGVINPSLGVNYTDLAAGIPEELAISVTVREMLSSLTDTPYSSDSAPSLLAAHIRCTALSRLTSLHDRRRVIELLESDTVRSWPVFGFSSRMRLLPLMLAQDSRITDALEWIERFEKLAPRFDQQLPCFSEFASFFRKRYSAFPVAAGDKA